jgi:hypothetical protein
MFNRPRTEEQKEENEDARGYDPVPFEDTACYINQFYKDISTSDDDAAAEFNKMRKHTKAQAHAQNARVEIELRRARRDPGPDITEGPTPEKFDKAVSGLGTNKKPGVDNMTHECIKNAPPALKVHLVRLFEHMWRLKHTPPAWQEAQTSLLFKKGDATLLKNYRPLTMLVTMLKLWEKILYLDLMSIIESRNLMTRLQTGTLPKTDAQITILLRKILVQMARDQGKEVYSTQYDYNKAFNRVNRSRLWLKMYKMGITGKLWLNIAATYSNHSETISIGDVTTDPQTLMNGLRQGSILSPILFALYLNELADMLEETQTGIDAGIAGCGKIPALMYVDDVEGLSTDPVSAYLQNEAISTFATMNDGVVHKTKTSMVTTSKISDATREMGRLNYKIPIHKADEVLGSLMALRKTGVHTPDQTEVMHRVKNMKVSLTYMHSNGMTAKGMGAHTIRKLMNAIAIPIAVHGLNLFQIGQTEELLIMEPLMGALRLCIQWKDEACWEWILNDMAILPPKLCVARKDIGIFIKACRKELPEMSNSLLTAKSIYQDKTTEMMRKLGLVTTSITALSQYQSKKAVKQALLRRQRRNALETTPQPVRELARRMVIEPKAPIFETIPVRTHFKTGLLKYRASLLFGDPGECFLCDLNHQHTALHCYAHCTAETIVHARKRQADSLERTAPKLLHYILLPTEAKLQTMLGATTRPAVSKLDQTRLSEAIISILDASPLT